MLKLELRCTSDDYLHKIHACLVAKYKLQDVDYITITRYFPISTLCKQTSCMHLRRIKLLHVRYTLRSQSSKVHYIRNPSSKYTDILRFLSNFIISSIT